MDDGYGNDEKKLDTFNIIPIGIIFCKKDIDFLSYIKLNRYSSVMSVQIIQLEYPRIDAREGGGGSTTGGHEASGEFI